MPRMPRCFGFGLLLVMGCCGLVACSDGDPDSYGLHLLWTNDSHSKTLGSPQCAYDPAGTGDGTMGGFSRLATLVKGIRTEVPAADPKADVMLFSAGDFSMGTLTVVAEDGAADLNGLALLGFDAAALGNHEFDWGADALVQMIEAATTPRVPLLCANLKREEPAASELKDLVLPYLVKELGNSGLKVGVFGLVGIDAAAVSNEPGLFQETMEQLVPIAQATVDTLRDTEKVKFVILLAHLGTQVDGTTVTGESIELAEQVRGIDVILSAHTHTRLEEATQVTCTSDPSWKTVVMEAGCYGEQLGRIDLVLEGSGKVKTATGQLIPIDDQITGDPAVAAWEQSLIDDVSAYLEAKVPTLPDAGACLDGDFCQELVQSDFDIPRHYYECNNLQSLVADAVRESCGCELAAMSNGGDVREDLRRVGGAFHLAEVFDASPLGIGSDNVIGYSAVKFYLTLQEIVLVLEFTTADMGLTNNDFMMGLSGFRLEMDTSQSQLSRIQKIWQYTAIDESDAGTLIFDRANGGFQIPQTTLVSICTSSYIAQFLSTFNLNPRNAAGDTVSDLDSLVCEDATGHQVKLWTSLACRLASFAPGKLSDQYNDSAAQNPIGPYYRRCRDLATHP